MKILKKNYDGGKDSGVTGYFLIEANSFRGPWVDYWREFRKDKYVTLTYGRKEVD